MKRVSFILLCSFVVLCLVPSLVSADELFEQKSRVSAKENPANLKEVSLYRYYQNHLLPYMQGAQAKVKVWDTEPEKKTGTPSSVNLQLSRKKTDETTQPPNTSPSEQISKGENGENKVFIALNKTESIGLAEINKSFPNDFRKEYKAEVSLGYKVSPLIEILFGKVQKIERSQDIPWGIHDDGWRLKLKKDF